MSREERTDLYWLNETLGLLSTRLVESLDRIEEHLRPVVATENAITALTERRILVAKMAAIIYSSGRPRDRKAREEAVDEARQILDSVTRKVDS